MFFSIIASSWFLLEKGWNFFISGEKSIEYVSMLFLTAFMLIYGGYEATFESENLWGSLIALFGATLRLWGRHSLGEAFSTRIKRPEKLVKTGPFRFIRHPLYAGLMLLWIGSILASMAYILLIPFSLNLIIILRRILREEKLLDEIEDFRDYKRRTWRLIPFLW